VLFWEEIVKEGVLVLAIFNCAVALEDLYKYCLFHGSSLLEQKEIPRSGARVLPGAKGVEICWS